MAEMKVNEMASLWVVLMVGGSAVLMANCLVDGSVAKLAVSRVAH